MAKLFKHHKVGDYCKFQDGSGTRINYPHIVEIVFNEQPSETKIWNNVKLDIESRKYDSVEDEYYDNQYGFFNRIIVYNARQCSGDLSIKVINASISTGDFFDNQIQGISEGVTATKREGNWMITGFRNYVTVNDKPLFSKEWSKIKDSFPIDKVVNTDVVSPLKEWNELEKFRDKYIIVRLIDNNTSSNKQLITRIVDARMTTSPR
jgi:hypothetical protein